MAKFKKVIVKKTSGKMKVKRSKSKRRNRKQLNRFQSLSKMYGKKIVKKKGKWISL